MFVEKLALLRQALYAGVNLFLGAGFSVLASDKNGNNLPLAATLSKELRDKFEKQAFSNLELQQLYTVIDSSEPEALRAYLTERFTVADFDPRYRILTNFNLKTIFTTNIDNLLHKSFSGNNKRYLNDVNFRGPSFGDSEAVEYIALHGCVLDTSRPYRFSQLELATSFTNDPDRWRFLQKSLSEVPTIFVGYSMRDAGTLTALAEAVRQPAGIGDLWVTIMPSSANEQIKTFLHALGFKIIEADTSQFLDLLVEESTHLPVSSSATVSGAKREFFQDETIPSPGTIPVRPLTTFFQGAAPTWSDVFSQRLHRPKSYDEVRELLTESRNVIISGAPATGKSTLLMQLASSINMRAHKLYCSNYLSPEKSDLLINRLAGESAIIFLDNCTDSMDGLDRLLHARNIQVLGADRDYKILTVQHRLPTSKFAYLDITNLATNDINLFINSIPGDLRRESRIIPSTIGDTTASVYEIIEANVRAPTLRERFRSVLRQLHESDDRLLELIISISYVHSCRTPMSLDMLLAYWYDSGLSYSEVYDLLRSLGASLAEYDGEFADENQDYYQARSALVAEAVMDSVSGSILKKVLIKFHRNVSPLRICRYDVFRRAAYDADIMGKAFPIWTDGLSFYEELYLRDESPYLLQQEALYLSRKKRHNEAFGVIDRAVALTRGGNWSIKNSHAIILFRANIEFAQEPGAQQTLDQSMEILRDCYRWDQRKPFHAKIFADHALRYWQVFADSQAKKYLIQAQDWLKITVREAVWVRDIRRLLREVERALESTGPS